jgi:hypothetical protein
MIRNNLSSRLITTYRIGMSLPVGDVRSKVEAKCGYGTIPLRSLICIAVWMSLTVRQVRKESCQVS